MSGTRRDVLIGAAAFAAAGLAWRLTPKRTLDLVSDEKLAEIVPAVFGLWSSRPSTQLVQPQTEGTLSAMLYSDTLTRLYSHAGTGERVMLLMAYGSTQSDLLQLHRPETCYPAFGYRISRSAVGNLDFGARDLPVRELIAVGPARTESILYWTRVGDALPTSNSAQRLDRLRMAMAGYVPDGLLARFSLAGNEEDSFDRLAKFAAELLNAVSIERLPALIGRSVGMADAS